MDNAEGDILVISLGMTWALIPEVYGFLAPEVLDLYKNHPRKAFLNSVREKYGLCKPSEVWVLTTDNSKENIQRANEWWQKISSPGALKIWVTEGVSDTCDEESCKAFRELSFRAILAASERVQKPYGVVLSLAGGRKTMSSDIQRAGSLFGCKGLLHVVDNGKLPASLRPKQSPDYFSKPLPEKDLDNQEKKVLCAGAITPVFIARQKRSEVLDVDWESKGAVHSERFPLPTPRPSRQFGMVAHFTNDGIGHSLVDEAETREREGHMLLNNYLSSISEREPHENWRNLYRLPPRIINELREKKLSSEVFDIVKKAPKAELHAHLGGFLSLSAQKKVGEVIWEASSQSEKVSAEKQVSPLLREEYWERNWSQNYLRNTYSSRERSIKAAAILHHLDLEELEDRLFKPTEPRCGLKFQEDKGFEAYELPGELSGSALLSHPDAIEPYAVEVYREAVKQGLRYCELRGSPDKYVHGDDFQGFFRRFKTGIEKAERSRTESSENKCDIRFIVIADRRDPSRVKDIVEKTAAARELVSEFIVGIDLAGKENSSISEDDINSLSGCFEKAFRDCIPLTIHAGEGESPENIWRAVYKLNCDRVGHGLTLCEKPELTRRLRDRNVAIELCPSSNDEVVGYTSKDSKFEYPLRELKDEHGLSVAICTDNPGISRTNITNEYIKASELLKDSGKDELNIWETLCLIKKSFAHSFLPAQAREKLLKEVDSKIFDLFKSLIT